jgi:peptidoglycan hydrolase-like protein with peptidoglycan-binding domain
MDEVLRKAGGTDVGAPPSDSAPAKPGGPAPPFPGTVLENYTEGHGTRDWQQQMSNRGWSIGVDDLYGDESEDVCRSFQSEKGLAVDGLVGPETWSAAWTAPVT